MLIEHVKLHINLTSMSSSLETNLPMKFRLSLGQV